MELTLQQQLSKEAHKRAIEACDDLAQLKTAALSLLDGFYAQRAAAIWAMKQNLSAPTRWNSHDHPS